MKKLQWGILGAAKIAREHLIPAIQKSQTSEVLAVASRSSDKAKTCADKFSIPKAYGSYDALLADPDIDIVYNPMPNHMHVPWSIKAIEAGKHVLCEKPLGLSAKDIEPLLAVAKSNPQLRVMEAFMYRLHPQWIKAKDIIESGELGDIKIVDAVFTYNSFDPDNVRYQKDIGGGALLDVGCYCISASRYLFGAEPKRVMASLEQDPNCDVDRHVTGMLNFNSGMAKFSSSMQVECTQGVTVLGTKGRMVMESPFFLPDHQLSKITLSKDGEESTFTFEGINHYVSQVDALAKSIMADESTPIPLSDAQNNMKVIDGIFESDRLGAWVELK